jgi:hydrogenase maturation protease
MRGGWEELERPAPDSVRIDEAIVRRRSRVRLKPRRNADVFDLALTDRVGVVDEIFEAVDGAIQLAVTVEDDPGRDLGEAGQLGHRFFFAVDEVEPLPPWLLVAGIGNVFLADDGFGVEVAQRLAQRELPPGVKVADFGIRGMDLAYELQEDYDAAILVDAVPRGQAPGTLYVIEPELLDGEPVPDAHAMDPVRVLGLARTLGTLPPRVLVVGCEPQSDVSLEDEELAMGLSPPVAAAMDEAVALVESVLEDLLAADGDQPPKE